MFKAAVAILEDDPRRTAHMRAVLKRMLPRCEHRFFQTAPDMLVWLTDGLVRTFLISLDHDLNLCGPRHLRETDAGSGRDVADELARQVAVCPVIVHSSNEPAAVGMIAVLERAGWACWRVYPSDDTDWIERDWALRLRELIREGWIRIDQIDKMNGA